GRVPDQPGSARRGGGVPRLPGAESDRESAAADRGVPALERPTSFSRRSARPDGTATLLAPRRNGAPPLSSGRGGARFRALPSGSSRERSRRAGAFLRPVPGRASARRSRVADRAGRHAHARRPQGVGRAPLSGGPGGLQRARGDPAVILRESRRRPRAEASRVGGLLRPERRGGVRRPDLRPGFPAAQPGSLLVLPLEPDASARTELRLLSKRERGSGDGS